MSRLQAVTCLINRVSCTMITTIRYRCESSKEDSVSTKMTTAIEFIIKSNRFSPRLQKAGQPLVATYQSQLLRYGMYCNRCL